MQIVRKVLFLAFSGFLAWQSAGLLSGLPQLVDAAWGEMLFVAWLINLFITGVFAFPSFAFTDFFRLLPNTYYRIKRPEQLRRAYRMLGVHQFRRLLLFFFWGQERNRKRFFDGTRSGLQQMDNQSKNAECGHLLPFFVITCATVYMFILAHWTLGWLTLAINIIGNAYPVLLQRHHRIRLQKLL